ncbi:MAG: hypothetical protein ACKVT0_04375 [Planctomycetaceae bacterium]
MSLWEWGLFFVTGLLALQILVSLMAYYHQFYRQEFLNEHLLKQQQASEAERATEASVPSVPQTRQETGTTSQSTVGDRQSRRNAA